MLFFIVLFYPKRSVSCLLGVLLLEKGRKRFFKKQNSLQTLFGLSSMRSCVVYMVFSLGLYILLFRKTNLTVLIVLLIQLFAFMNQALFVKSKGFFPLILNVCPPNSHGLAWVTSKDIQKGRISPRQSLKGKSSDFSSIGGY